MKRLLLLLCVSGVVSCNHTPMTPIVEPVLDLPSNRPPANFTSAVGDFAVWMPGKVTETTEVTSQMCATEEPQSATYLARGNEAYWRIETCLLAPQHSQELTSSDMIDHLRDEVLVETFSTLTEERDVPFAGSLGRHIIADSGLRSRSILETDGLYKVRIFVVDARMYRLSTYAFKGNPHALEHMDAFLRSFVLQ